MKLAHNFLIAGNARRIAFVAHSMPFNCTLYIHIVSDPYFQYMSPKTIALLRYLFKHIRNTIRYMHQLEEDSLSLHHKLCTNKTFFSKSCPLHQLTNITSTNFPCYYF